MEAILQLLTTCNFKVLHLKRDDGSRNIDMLYSACSSSGLISKAATDVRSKYMGVFDVCLDNLLGCWVVDYVEEVCGDRLLTSHDPAEAQLLDGEFVWSWCRQTLTEIESTLVAALKSEAMFQRFQSRALHRDLGKVSLLVQVLQALERLRSFGSMTAHFSAGQSVGVELEQAALLKNCFQVMAWCARHRLLDRPHTGRYTSVPEWMRQVQRRRERGRKLFLDDMLNALKIGGAYPFASLQNMLFMIFFTVRESHEASWHAKLSLLLYYLLDLDYLQPGQPDLEDFRSSFSLPASQVACWQCMYLLDCVEQATPTPRQQLAGERALGASSNSSSSSQADPLLAQACELLSSRVQAEAPVKMLQVLVDLGRADVALTLHRASAGIKGGSRGGSVVEGQIDTADLAHAHTMLDLRLRCGLLTEAFLAMRSHLATLTSEPDQLEHTVALVVQLAEWAASASSAGAQAQQPAVASGRPAALHALSELPWSAREEDALIGWFVSKLEAGSAAGDMLPQYFLGRGCMAEAVASFSRWSQVQKQRQEQGCAEERSVSAADVLPLVDAMVNAAAELLTLPVRNVAIAASASGGVHPPWPARLLQGFCLQTDGNVPVMTAAVPVGGYGPPFMSSRMPEQPLPSGCGREAEPGGTGCREDSALVVTVDEAAASILLDAGAGVQQTEHSAGIGGAVSLFPAALSFGLTSGGGGGQQGRGLFSLGGPMGTRGTPLEGPLEAAGGSGAARLDGVDLSRDPKRLRMSDWRR